MNEGHARLDELRIEREPETPPSPWGGRIVFLVLGMVLGGGLVWALHGASRAPAQADQVPAGAPPTAEAAGAQPPAVPASRTVLDAAGYVVARRSATVSAEVTGRVVEVNVEEGMQVEAGDVLARLDDATARANVALAQSEIATQRAALREIASQLATARRNAQRRQSLADSSAVSEAELDAALSEVERLEAAVERTRSGITVARRRLALAEQALDNTIVRAPFAGVVTAKAAQPGEIVSPVSGGGGFTRTGICTLVDMQSLEIAVDVSENYIGRVAPGQAVQATLNAYPDWTIPGRVEAVIPTANRRKGTFGVRVALESNDPRILPEMAVRVAFGQPDR